jgi:hypothetical protein
VFRGSRKQRRRQTSPAVSTSSGGETNAQHPPKKHAVTKNYNAEEKDKCYAYKPRNGYLQLAQGKPKLLPLVRSLCLLVSALRRISLASVAANERAAG